MPAPKDPIKRAQWAANISAAKTGKKLSPEPIAKIAAAQKMSRAFEKQSAGFSFL